MLIQAWRRIAAVMAAIILVITFNFGAFAQESPRGGSGLNISPTRTELVVDAGKTTSFKINISNVSGQDITAKVYINDFESDGQTGEPKIIIDNDKQLATSVKGFLKDVNDIPLKKDEKKEVEIRVEIPNNTAPGAYFGVVRYAAIPAGREAPESGQVALTASVGSLVLIEVPGNIKEQIQVLSAKAFSGDKSRSFFSAQPDQIRVEIKNNGNGFSKPFGRVSLMRGKKEVYSYELNNTDPKANILPNSNRTFTEFIKDSKKVIKTPGKYTVVANLSHSQGGEVITQTSSFWYVPNWVFAALAAFLVILVGGAYLVYRTRFSVGRRSRR